LTNCCPPNFSLCYDSGKEKTAEEKITYPEKKCSLIAIFMPTADFK